MKTKMGRPKLPKGTAKGVQIGVRFNPKEDEQIEKAIAKSGFIRDKAEWIREAALEKASLWETKAPVAEDLIWGDLPYTLEELQRKTIEFKIKVKWDDMPAPATTTGNGKIYVRELKGKFHIQIISKIGPNKEKIIDLNPKHAALIKQQPEGSHFEYSLTALQL